MTISSTTRKAGPYTGNGVTTVFPFAFKVFAVADVRVVRADQYGAETDLTLGTHYTVSLNSNQDSNPGGTVTLQSAPASSYTITLTSQVANLQPVTMMNQGGYYPTVINDALDRLTIQIQQLSEQVSRAAKAPISSGIAGDSIVASILNNVSATAENASVALDSATNAVGAWNSFRSQYYGPMSSDPVLDPVGNSVDTGDCYFNTANNALKFYTGSAWQLITSPPDGSITAVKLAPGSVTNSKTAFTTPAQFLADTSPATTAFVQRAMGNRQGIISATGNNSITVAASQVGSLVVFSGGANASCGFPNPVFMPAGVSLEVWNNSNFPYDLGGGGGLFLGPSGSGSGLLTMPPQSSLTFTGDGSDWIVRGNSTVTQGTLVSNASGTSITFTGILPGVKRITVMLVGVSTNGTSRPIVQIGSGAIDTTGYAGSYSDGTTAVNFSSGFLFGGSAAANVIYATYTLTNVGGNVWQGALTGGYSSSALISVGNGAKTLTGTLDRLRITTTNGTDTFDAGSINILYD